LAYNYGDDNQLESAADKAIKELRESYVSELFKYKSQFDRLRATGENDQAFIDLIKKIKTYIEKMTRLEKNKYMRERIYYQREK
jgi:hypothetical protein